MSQLKIVFLGIFIQLSCVSCKPVRIAEEKIDPTRIAAASGYQGVYDQDSGTFKVTLDRPDLSVNVQGVRITPAMGLRSWMSLSGTKNHAVLLGDIPLKEDEVNRALRAAVKAGLSVTSLHNRFLMDSPRIFSLHVEGLGDEATLAGTMRLFLNDLSQGRFSSPVRRDQKPIDPAKSTLDPKQMESLLWKGEWKEGVYRVSLARGTTLAKQKIYGFSGAESWAAFSGSPAYAVVNGDIAALELELPFVLKDLMDAGIQISSIHTHMTQEHPRLVFVHFWGIGPVETLAQGAKFAIWEKENFQSQ